MIADLGRILASAGINARMTEDDKFARRVVLLIKRFSKDDWGDMDLEDIDTNRIMARSLRNGGGGTVMGSYGRSRDTSKSDATVWIIQNQENTTVLFPDEY